MLDLTQINLWSAEDVTIEQAPEEVRVYIRSWRVRSTTPETRTDISTGDQQTNLYRGFFGRRFRQRRGVPVRCAAVRHDAAERVRHEQRSDWDHRTRRLGERPDGASTDSSRASVGIAAIIFGDRATGDSIPRARVHAHRFVFAHRLR